MPSTPAPVPRVPLVSTAAPPTARERIENRVRGQLMQMALQQLFDVVRGSREALPHLAVLEKALGQRGVAAVAEVPPAWRVRMAAQLACLPVPEGDRELIELRALLGAGLQAPAEPRQADKPVLSAFMTDSRLQMQEVGHSAFAQALGAVPGSAS